MLFEANPVGIWPLNLFARSACGVLDALLVLAQQPLVLFNVFIEELGVKSLRAPARIQTAQLAIH